MKRSFLIVMGLVTVLCAAVSLAVFAADAAPLPVGVAEMPPPHAVTPQTMIFDTDMGPDCDDVGALFLLHGAVQRGQITLLATMGCTSSKAIAPALDAINSWFGHPEILVGTLKDPGLLGGGSFSDIIAQRYPHKLPSGTDYPDAVTLYRQILAKQPDGSVMITAVGPLRNMANLLKSGADAASPLSGPALVKQKVKRLVVMGGAYPPNASTTGEWNFVQDAASSLLVCSTWPTAVLFVGEGGSTNSGRRVTYEMPEHNPLTVAYTNYPGVGFAGDRLSWDPVTCLAAVNGISPLFKEIGGGKNVVDAKGVNSWTPGVESGHSYLLYQQSKKEIEVALEDMMVAGKPHPTNLSFNTAYYTQDGMCHITSKGAADANTTALKAFDRDGKSAWLDKVAASWIQCQYADGRKYLVTSYTVSCTEVGRLPRSVQLSGSNDGGSTWMVLDTQADAGFSAVKLRREYSIAKPAEWNIYRLSVTAANENEGVQISDIELLEAINCRPKVAVAGMTLDHKSLTIPVDSRATLNATITPMETFDREVAWVSSDATVAEVRKIGEQIAIVVGKKTGDCTITASIGTVKQECIVKVSASTLPTGWDFNGLSAPPIPGSVLVSDGQYTLTGCGHGISSWWERVRDQGVFVSQAVSGAGTLSARLSALGPNVGGPAYQRDDRPPSVAGLMIRESLNQACGRFLLIQVEATGNLVCRWRDKTAVQDDNQSKGLGKVNMPIYLKLVNTGTEIQFFTSTDGQTWAEPLMTHAAVFDDKSRIGLFLSSGNTFVTTTATFDTVKVSQ